MPVNSPRIRLLIRVASPGQVVVETDEHAEFGEGVISGVDSAQGVRHGSGGVGDDERIPGIFSELKMILQFEGWNLVRRVQ